MKTRHLTALLVFRLLAATECAHAAGPETPRPQHPRCAESPPPASPVQGREPLRNPYAPLMAVIGGGCLGPFTDAQVRQIAETWQMVNSHGGMLSRAYPKGHNSGRGELMKLFAGPSCGVDDRGRSLGDRIKEISPGFVLSNYRNGSYVSQFCPDEAGQAEARFPLAISIWNTGSTLLTGLGAEDTGIRISKVQVPDTRPEPREGRPPIYPFKRSTTQGEHTRSTREYVAWIRLGDEILRVEDVSADGEAIAMRVRRGVWGTTATGHERGDPVFQPVNIGRNTGIDRGDAGLGGRMDDPSGQPGLRYAFMTFDPKFIHWLGEKAKPIFEERYDVCWLDVSVSTWYNNANAYGDEVRPWNIRKNAPLTPDDYREWQQEKTDGLYRMFPGGKFFINNVKASTYFDNGHDRYQLSGENGHRAVDGGCMEMYARTRDERAWRQVVAMTLDFANSGFWGVAWAKGTDGDRYRRFSYATYLLAYSPGARLYFAIGEGGGLLVKPQALYYYDLGAPVQRYASVDEARHPEIAGLYQRAFRKAKILVNPAEEPKGPVSLGNEYIDTENGARVTEVSIEPNSAKVLLVAE